jgi:hypothetical protein
MRRIYLYGIAVSLGLYAAAAAHAAGHPIPTKIDCGLEFRCNVQMGPQAYIPRAPWYTYFPADPNLLARAPGTTPYPTWPTNPPGTPAPTPAPSAPAPAQQLGWSGVQPAGYVMVGQAPSYWYGR